MSRTGSLALLLSALAALAPAAQAPPVLKQRLEALRAGEPVAVAIQLELREERSLRHKTASGEAAVRLDVDQDRSGLRVRWEASALAAADAEERERDASSERLTPVRDAMRELEPARIAHLLDQARTVAGLVRGAPVEDVAEAWQGQPARRLVYAFEPRVSWADARSLRSSHGRLTLWLAPDGTPLFSESVASFEGKTSRTFGRFKGTTSVRTRYAAEGSRLRVAEREVDELTSREDGGDVEHVVRRFVVEPR